MFGSAPVFGGGGASPVPHLPLNRLSGIATDDGGTAPARPAASSFAVFSDAAVAVARRGAELFVQRQQCLLAPGSDDGAPVGNRTRAQWSHDFLQFLAPLLPPSDVGGEAFVAPGFGTLGPLVPLWDLLTIVMRLGETSLATSNAAAHFVAWHATYFGAPTRAAQDQELYGQLMARDPSKQPPEFWKLYFWVAMQHMFGGDLPTAGMFLTEARNALNNEKALGELVYAVATDIIELLIRPFDANDLPGPDSSFAKWQLQARRLVGDGKDVLCLREGDAADAGPLGSLKMVLLDVALVASGDEGHLTKLASSLRCDAVWHMTAVLAMQRPSLPLRDVALVFQQCDQAHRARTATTAPNESRTTSARGFGGGGDGGGGGATATNAGSERGDPALRLWLRRGVEALVCVTKVYDAIDAALAIADGAVAAGASDDAIFASLFFAAHVSDICAPAFAPADGSHAPALARRHVAVRRYVSYVQRSPALWDVAASYVAFSPLMDASAVLSLFRHAASFVTADGDFGDACGDLGDDAAPGVSFVAAAAAAHSAYFARGCPFQRLLHSRVRAVCGGAIGGGIFEAAAASAASASAASTAGGSSGGTGGVGGACTNLAAFLANAERAGDAARGEFFAAVGAARLRSGAFASGAGAVPALLTALDSGADVAAALAPLALAAVEDVVAGCGGADGRGPLPLAVVRIGEGVLAGFLSAADAAAASPPLGRLLVLCALLSDVAEAAATGDAAQTVEAASVALENGARLLPPAFVRRLLYDCAEALAAPVMGAGGSDDASGGGGCSGVPLTMATLLRLHTALALLPVDDGTRFLARVLHEVLVDPRLRPSMVL